MKKKWMKFMASILCVCVVTALYQPVSVRAEQVISVDGSFADWGGIGATPVNGLNYSVAVNGQNLYIHAQGNWTNYMGATVDISINGIVQAAPFNQIKIAGDTSGETASFPVSDAWSQGIAGSNMICVNSNPAESWGYQTMEWEAVVPLSCFGYADAATPQVTATVDGVGVGVTMLQTDVPQTPATETETTSETESETQTETETETESESETETETEEDTDLAGSGVISIDGYYDDWFTVPQTDITYGGFNGQCINKGSIFQDGNVLYGYFSMHDLYNSQMQVQIIDLKINDTIFSMEILPVNADGTVDWSFKTNNLGNGTYTNYGVFIGYYTHVNGDVAFTIYDSNHSSSTTGDKIEFSIDMKELALATGIPVEEMRKIEMHNPNIGAEWVTMVGTPTYPVMFFAFGIPIVLFGYFKVSKKKKEELK